MQRGGLRVVGVECIIVDHVVGGGCSRVAHNELGLE